MLQLEEKVAFVRSATAQMARYTPTFIGSIVGVDEASSENPHVGSALRVAGKSRFILTAAHVARDAHARFGALAISAGSGVEPYLLAWPPRTFDEIHDYALFEVGSDYPVDSVSFWPVDRIAEDDALLTSDYLFLHGYPAVRSNVSAVGVHNRSLPYGAMCREDDLPSDISDFQFALDFDPAHFTSETTTESEWLDPGGLSGSPVWRIGAAGRTREGWTPENSVLVGIATLWKPDSKCLLATRSSAIASVLRSL